ncbi:succinylglutamate desuccinylase/aspartoacylase family protein, partial [Thermoproteota archaeon]
IYTIILIETVNFGDVKVKPGFKGYGKLIEVELSDSSSIKLPIIVINGLNDGPKMLISSAIHGGELIGFNVIRNLTRNILNPMELRGLVVALPIGNPLGFQFGERYSPQDHIFPKIDEPGDIGGSITQRIGATVWKEVTSKMDLRFDIHGNYPPCTAFSSYKMNYPRVSEENGKMAEATGLTVVYSNKPGTLAWNEEPGKDYQPVPSVLIELIDARRITEVSTDLGTRAVLNVMKAWDMIDGEVEPQPKEYVWGGGWVEDGGILRASRGGVIQFTKTPGVLIEKDEVIAEIYNPYGDILEEIKFPFKGYIRAYTYPRHQAVNTGDIIAYITHEK